MRLFRSCREEVEVGNNVLAGNDGKKCWLARETPFLFLCSVRLLILNSKHNLFNLQNTNKHLLTFKTFKTYIYIYIYPNLFNFLS